MESEPHPGYGHLARQVRLERERAAVRLDRDGHSLRQIADKLGTSHTQVARDLRNYELRAEQRQADGWNEAQQVDRARRANRIDETDETGTDGPAPSRDDMLQALNGARPAPDPGSLSDIGQGRQTGPGNRLTGGRDPMLDALTNRDPYT